MATTYLTILMTHLEQMQIEVAAAGVSEIHTAAFKARDQLYDCNRFLFILEGRGRMYVRDQEIALKRGKLCILLNGTPHRIVAEPGTPVVMQWCHFHASYGDRELYRTLHLPVDVQTADTASTESLMQRLIDHFDREALTSKLRVKAAMLELISVYLEHVPASTEERSSSEELKKIDTVLQYIDEHLAANITVEDLARQVYLHPNYFIVFFKGLLGYSPIQYVNHRRMEVAKTLLQQEGSNVSDVASRVGMQIYYFSRMFKAHTGLTPSRFRKHSALPVGTGDQAP